MGMLGLLFAALIVALLVMFQMRGRTPAPQQPSAPVQQAAAAAKVDASDYRNMVKDVKTQVDASMRKEAARIQDVQDTQKALDAEEPQ